MTQQKAAIAAQPEPPVTADFLADVAEEAKYQRDHWGYIHDATKSDADWFWTLGHLAGKAIHDSEQTVEKQRHRLRAAAALLLNWDRQIALDSGSEVDQWDGTVDLDWAGQRARRAGEHGSPSPSGSSPEGGDA